MNFKVKFPLKTHTKADLIPKGSYLALSEKTFDLPEDYNDESFKTVSYVDDDGKFYVDSKFLNTIIGAIKVQFVESKKWIWIENFVVKMKEIKNSTETIENEIYYTENE